jgi:hypothetical protein
MHAGFQFVFSSFLPQRFAGSTSISCVFDICEGLVLLRIRQGWSRFSPTVPMNRLRCYCDTRLKL